MNRKKQFVSSPKTVGDYRRAKLSTYLDQRRRQCDETNRWVSIDMPRAEILNSYTYGNHTAKYAHEERHLSMQRCEIEGIGGNDGWTVHRLGPYVGTGGYDWHQTYVHPLPGPAKAKGCAPGNVSPALHPRGRGSPSPAPRSRAGQEAELRPRPPQAKAW